MRNKLFALLLISLSVFATNAQSYEKIADDSIAYIKASTFGKPSVAKKTGKLALAQVRVHFKFITTQAVETRTNGARATVYLDGAMTDADLQKLTDDFYSILQRKLGALGIEFVDWQQIQATEYYKNRMLATEEKRKTNGDAKNGQAWLSYTAFDGPVIYRANPINPAENELIAYGKAKKLSNMAESLAAELAMFDAVVDFTSINLQTGVGTIWQDDGKYNNYTANQNVTAILSVPQSWTLFYDQKNGFDQYSTKLPVAVRYNFANRLYEDENKAALKTRTFFGDVRFTFTPVVVEADRELYLNAARRLLEQYADVFVEKMRLIRGGVKPGKSDDKSAPAKNPDDNKTVGDIKEEARKNNDTSPLTFGENMDAARQAASEKKWNLAAGYYTEAIKIQPDEYEPYFQRGVLYMNYLLNYKAAINDFTKTLELNPREIAALYNRGSAYLQLQDFKKAFKDLDAFIAIKSDLPEAYLNRGVARLNLKKTDEAIEDFNTGLRLNPRFPNLYRARAIAYKIKGEAQLAQADELRAAELERGQ